MSSGRRSARSISCEQSGAISVGTGASVVEPRRGNLVGTVTGATLAVHIPIVYPPEGLGRAS
jgi:hypothetical protein